MDPNQNNTSVKEQTVKQQVVESLKNANNVLVTVSTNPTVDQLAACIGLTLMMNKLDKHATAVFSGVVPSTLDFLQPEKTLEANTDSLRDFIISLDKTKADKLRYKVEDDVVRIYITPYRTSITDADLEFTQGDFNVDVVVALGVDNRDHLDQAILEHGRILHDAVVVGVSCGATPADMGALNWHEPTASSLCEMLVSISESFKTGLLDSQMSTAFLTGIVAETERFSNDRTTPKVMTMSAQLMAAGANQQLIANQLTVQPTEEPMIIPEEPVSLPEEPSLPVEEPGTLHIAQDPVEPGPIDTSLVEQGSGENGLSFSMHEEEHVVVPVTEVEESLGTSGQDVTNTTTDDESVVSTEPQPPEIEIDEHGKMVDLVEQEEERASHRQRIIQPLGQPMAPQAKTDLNGYVFGPPTNGGTLTANSIPEHEQPDESVDPLAETHTDTPIMEHGGEQVDEPIADVAQDPTQPHEQTLADLEVAVASPHVAGNVDDARSAIEQAANETVPNPADQGPDNQSPPVMPPPFMPPMPAPGPNGEVNLPPPQQ